MNTKEIANIIKNELKIKTKERYKLVVCVILDNISVQAGK